MPHNIKTLVSSVLILLLLLLFLVLWRCFYLILRVHLSSACFFYRFVSYVSIFFYIFVCKFSLVELCFHSFYTWNLLTKYCFRYAFNNLLSAARLWLLLWYYCVYFSPNLEKKIVRKKSIADNKIDKTKEANCQSYDVQGKMNCYEKNK